MVPLSLVPAEQPNNALEPTPDSAFSSAFAVDITSPAWLSFFVRPHSCWVARLIWKTSLQFELRIHAARSISFIHGVGRLIVLIRNRCFKLFDRRCQSMVCPLFAISRFAQHYKVPPISHIFTKHYLRFRGSAFCRRALGEHELFPEKIAIILANVLPIYERGLLSS